MFGLDFLCVAIRWLSLDGEQYLSNQDQSLWQQVRPAEPKKDRQEQLDQGKYSIWVLIL